jgi:membrane-associated phospholipid phosphatase
VTDTAADLLSFPVVLTAFIAALAVLWAVSYVLMRLTLDHAPRATAGIRKIGRRPRIADLWMRLRARFPRATGFLGARVATDRFTGLALTLLGVAALYVVIVFAGLVDEVYETEEIRAIDDAVFALVAPLRLPELVGFFSSITHAGDVENLAIVAAVATGFLWAHGPARYIPPLWIAIAGSQLTTWTGKFVIHRPRPDFVLDITAWSPSFPSGHATGAMAVYGLIAYVIARDLPTVRQRFEVGFWTAIMVAAVAFSRVFLNVHYPTDVAAGLLVGVFWIIVGITVAELGRHRTVGQPGR